MVVIGIVVLMVVTGTSGGGVVVALEGMDGVVKPGPLPTVGGQCIQKRTALGFALT